MIDERDGNFPPGAYKKLFAIDLSGATDVGPSSTVSGATYTAASGGLLIGDKVVCEEPCGFDDQLDLGAAWKAMPADLSRPRLGDRGLDLLDDMSNWGARKALLGEVDVFKIDHTHELYGHMNVNYVRLDRVPRFDEGWQPILEAML